MKTQFEKMRANRMAAYARQKREAARETAKAEAQRQRMMERARQMQNAAYPGSSFNNQAQGFGWSGYFGDAGGPL